MGNPVRYSLACAKKLAATKERKRRAREQALLNNPTVQLVIAKLQKSLDCDVARKNMYMRQLASHARERRLLNNLQVEILNLLVHGRHGADPFCAPYQAKQYGKGPPCDVPRAGTPIA